jgi:hypothetical protein
VVNRVWPQTTIDAVVKLTETRVTYAETARRLGLTRGMVAGIMYRHARGSYIERPWPSGAAHGMTGRNKLAEERTYIEPWHEYRARMKKARNG